MIFFRLGPLVLIGALIAPPSSPAWYSTDECVSRFTKLLKTPAEKAVPDAPARIALPASKKEATDSFRLALDAWEKNVDQPALARRLKEVAEAGAASPENTVALKESRKWASILRSHYNFLAADQNSPGKFAKFTKQLGELNDAIANGAPAEEITRLARGSRKLLKRQPGSARMAEFTPASSKKLAARTEEIRVMVAGLLQTTCTPHEFHEARKALKELLAYSQTRQALQPAPENLRAYEFLRYANDEMGADHDEFVRLAAAGKMDYESDRLTLRPAVKNALGALNRALLGN